MAEQVLFKPCACAKLYITMRIVILREPVIKCYHQLEEVKGLIYCNYRMITALYTKNINTLTESNRHKTTHGIQHSRSQNSQERFNQSSAHMITEASSSLSMRSQDRV